MSSVAFAEKLSEGFDKILETKKELGDLLVRELSNKEVAKLEEKSEEEKKLSEWLGRLKLLYGVPFNYLVADEGLLPVNSIRFFQIDNNWIASLLDGAYSIGSNVKDYRLLDEIIAEGYKDKIEGLNSNASKVAAKLRNTMFEAPLNSETSDNDEIITGFLLRSEAVSNWPGLEVDGFKCNKDNDTKLSLLRMEHLSTDILLCMFAGKVDKVMFHTPAEELHFGFDNISEKFLKDEKGNKLKNDIKIDVSDAGRKSDEKGIVNVKVLAEKMYQKLAEEMKVKTFDKFTSDKFALQMTLGVDTAQLTRHPK